ncbi:MAG TPA: hypothetical protein VFE82_03615 [Ramlibacter sp.]|uniref:hypothetical protein n=1 Tax=Ramlibacter sp. TaxID=1917967 RepID=UPI002D3A51E8|nr:hypothetical protein [Ramlibacter sp.]HZY17540.1 hypothetical protein [Ramlibacter sp.]
MQQIRTAGLVPRGGLVVLALLAALQGCSSQQLYEAGRGWQRDACNKLQDAQERARCMQSADTPHEQYQRESQTVRERR